MTLKEFAKDLIKKESPNEGTETGFKLPAIVRINSDIKKESPNEGTETRMGWKG